MIEPMKPIILKELGYDTVEVEAALRATAMTIEELAYALRPIAKIEPDWKPGHVRVSAGQVIGSVQVGGLRVEVRPRLAAREAVTMIRYALGGKVDSTLHATFPTGASVGLDELICHVLADEADRIRQAGLSRKYEKQHERLSVLRGRPDFVSSFPWDGERAGSLVCSFHLLTCDNLDNQLLRAALEQSCLLDISQRTRSRLLAHRRVWTSAAASIWPTHEHFSGARSRYTRLSEHYRLVHNLAELITFRRRPKDLFEVGDAAMGGLTLSMPMLFEKFVERLMNDLFSRTGISVAAQRPDQGALLDDVGSVYRRVRPDLVLSQGGKPVMVIDAKYKEYWPAEDGGAPSRRVSNADIYQLFFYAQRLQLRHSLPKPPAACIISPLPAEDERDGLTEIAGRYRRIVWRAGHELAGDVRLLNLPLTSILRSMVERKDWLDRLEMKEHLEAMLVAISERPAQGGR